MQAARRPACSPRRWPRWHRVTAWPGTRGIPAATCRSRRPASRRDLRSSPRSRSCRRGSVWRSGWIGRGGRCGTSSSGRRGRPRSSRTESPPPRTRTRPAPVDSKASGSDGRSGSPAGSATTARPPDVSSIPIAPSHPDRPGRAAAAVVDSALEELTADDDGLTLRGTRVFATSAVAIASTVAAERIRRRYVRRVGATHQSISI